MDIDKFAAIDIGSNGVRMLISNVITTRSSKVFFQKNSLVRVPIRLGEDSFTSGNISDINLKRLKIPKKKYSLVNTKEELLYKVTNVIKNKSVIKSEINKNYKFRDYLFTKSNEKNLRYFY